jgi:hypothetical protein
MIAVGKSIEPRIDTGRRSAIPEIFNPFVKDARFPYRHGRIVERNWQKIKRVFGILQTGAMTEEGAAFVRVIRVIRGCIKKSPRITRIFANECGVFRASRIFPWLSELSVAIRGSEWRRSFAVVGGWAAFVRVIRFIR